MANVKHQGIQINNISRNDIKVETIKHSLTVENDENLKHRI